MPITKAGRTAEVTVRDRRANSLATSAGAESFIAWRDRDETVREDWLATLETHGSVLTDVQAAKWAAIVIRHANNCFAALCAAARSARRRDSLRRKLDDPALMQSPDRPGAVREEREVAGLVSHWLVTVATDELWATTAWQDMSPQQRTDTGAADAWEVPATRTDLTLVALETWTVNWPPGFDPFEELRGFQGFPGVNTWLRRAGRLPDAKQALDDLRQWLDRIVVVDIDHR